MTTTEGLLETVPSHAQGLSILLVDRDPSSLMHMASLLEQYSFKVTPINIACDALKLVNKKTIPFDFVMANLEQANIESIAIICPLLMNNTPFILFSYEGDESAGRRSLDNEVTHRTFKKPVALEDLKDVWHHAFTERRRYQKVEASMKEPSRPAGVNGGNNGSSLRESNMLKNMDSDDMSGCRPMQSNDDACGSSKIANPEVFPKQSIGTTTARSKGKVPLIIREYPDSFAALIPTILNDDGRRRKGIQINDVSVNQKVCPRGSMGTRHMVRKGKEPLVVGECLGSSEAFGLTTKRMSENSTCDKRRGKHPRTNHEKADSRRGSTATGIEGGCSRKVIVDVIRNNTGSKPRPRAVWSSEMHRKFVEALTALGDKNARPKKILRMMDVPNLTQRQVGSHLQKYKAQVQRICENTAIDIPSPSVTRLSTPYGGSEPSQWMMPPYQLEQEGFDHFRSKADSIDIPSPSENASTLESDHLQLQSQDLGYPSFSSMTGNLSWPYGGYHLDHDHDQLQGNFYVLDQQNDTSNSNGTSPHDLQNCIAKDGSLALPSIESNTNIPFGIPCSNNGMVSTVFPELEQIDPPPDLTSFIGAGLPELEGMPFVTTLKTVMPCEGGGQLHEVTSFSRNTEPQQEILYWDEIYEARSTGYLPNQESDPNFCNDIRNQNAYPYGCTSQQQTTEMDILTCADMNQPLNSSVAFPDLAGNIEGRQLNTVSLQSSTSQSEISNALTSTMFPTTPMEVEAGNMYVPDFADAQYQLEFPSEITNSTVISMPLPLEGQLDYHSNSAGSLGQGERAHFWTETGVATNEYSNLLSSKNDTSAMLGNWMQDFSRLFAGEASSSLDYGHLHKDLVEDLG